MVFLSLFLVLLCGVFLTFLLSLLSKGDIFDFFFVGIKSYLFVMSAA